MSENGDTGFMPRGIRKTAKPQGEGTKGKKAARPDSGQEPITAQPDSGSSLAETMHQPCSSIDSLDDVKLLLDIDKVLSQGKMQGVHSAVSEDLPNKADADKIPTEAVNVSMEHQYA